MKISIITICFNAEKLIEKTIKSVINQTYEEIEYLIIDGKSTDSTMEIVRKYSYCNNLFIFSEKDYGIYNAMNRGISRVSGEYVYFLNAGDCLADENVIQKVVNEIGNKRDYIYYGKVRYIAKTSLPEILEAGKSEVELKEGFFKGQMPCHQAIFAPQKALRTHYFNESYCLRADFEWIIYCFCLGWKFIFMPYLIADYDGSGVTSNIQNKMLQEDIERETFEILSFYQNSFLLEFREIPIRRYEPASKNELADKHFRMFMLMNKWVHLSQKNKRILDYFYAREIKRVAIYGLGYIGERLLEELSASSVEVKYIIDKKEIRKCLDIPVIKLDSILEEVDVIIVTAIYFYEEIKEQLRELTEIPIVSLEAIIDELL